MTKEDDYLLFNKEILGGLKLATSKGESLKDAMMTFYQAGYDKEEIENAAREFLNERNNPEESATIPQSKVDAKVENKKSFFSKKENSVSNKVEEKKDKEKDEKKGKVEENSLHNPSQDLKKNSPSPLPTSTNTIPPKNKQKVSSYESIKKPKIPKSNTLTFVLVFVLLILLGVLAAIFVYKGSFVNFINSLLNKGA